MQLRVPASVRKEIMSLSSVSTARFIGAALFDWAVIFGLVALALWAGHFMAYAAAVLLVATRQHAFMILVHDATHFRAHRKLFWNDVISNTLCAFPVFFDTAIYRFRHLRHHEHLNTEQDPDWTRKIPFEDWHFPKSGAGFIKMMTVYFFFKGTLEWLHATWYFSGITGASGLPRSNWRLAGKALFWGVVLSALTFSGHLGTFALFWLLPFYLVFPVLQRLRSVAEHFAVTYADDLNSSRDISPPLIEKFMLAPHNVHIHLSHHLFPAVPFHNLPRLHALLAQTPEFAGAQINSSYLWPSKRSLWSDILRTKRVTSPKSAAEPEQIDQLKAS